MTKPAVTAPGPRRPIASAVLVAVCVCAFGALGGCHRAAKTMQTGAAQSARTPVEIERVTVGDVVRWTPVTGSLVSLQDVTLSSRIGGRIAEVYVRQGDSVAPGQVVARIDMRDQEAQRQSAEQAVVAARARLAQATAVYHQQQTSSSSAVQAAQAALNQQTVTTRTGIQSAEAGLEAAKAQLSQVREGARSQDVRRAQTQVAIAQATRDKAASDARRYRQLAKSGAISESTLEQYETSERVADENLRAAQETLSLLKEGARSQEITQAEQGVRQAEERLRQAKAAAALDDVRRADLATAKAGLAQNEVKRAEIQAARAALGQASSALSIASKAVADSLIRSPIAGQVAARTAEPGQVVAAGTPLLRVVGLNSVYFEPKVPDREMAHIKVGQNVEVTVAAYPGRKFRGTVTRVYPAASEDSRTFAIRVALADSGGLLRPQMYAEGRICTETRAGAVQAPVAALLRSEDTPGKARVFAVENGVAREHEVSIGLTSADGLRAQVTGLAAEAVVITSGQRGIADGDAVSATPAAGTEGR